MARKPADPEEELRWMAQEVRGYVEAVLNSLAANVPKSTPRIEELLQEDGNVKRKRERVQKQSSLLSKLTRQLSIHDNRAAAASGMSNYYRLVLVMAIAEGIATLPRMVMWAPDQTLAAAALQTACRQHHLVPVIGDGLGFGYGEVMSNWVWCVRELFSGRVYGLFREMVKDCVYGIGIREVAR
nr:dynamin-like protein 6 [Tanacetum cinerariifolium]